MSIEAPEQVYENLAAGEDLIIGLETWSARKKPEYAFLTDRRVLYFNEKMLGRYDLKTIPYAKLLEMKASTGRLMYGVIQFKSEEKGYIRLNNVLKDQIEPFVQALETAINNIAVEPITIKRSKSLGGKRTWAFKKSAEMLFKTRTPETGILTRQPQVKEDPLKALKMRFVKGEITKEEYLEMKKLLEE